MTWRRRRTVAKKPRPNFVPRGEFTAAQSGPAVPGTFGPASPGRVLSPGERRAIEERLRQEGALS
jgi:hypothetical protein